jgi:hypothetical protein
VTSEDRVRVFERFWRGRGGTIVYQTVWGGAELGRLNG